MKHDTNSKESLKNDSSSKADEPVVGQSDPYQFLKSMDYDSGKNAVSPEITEPGGALEQDADRQASLAMEKLKGGEGDGQTVMSKMEAAFEADFSSVKIHNDSQGDKVAQHFGASAITKGNDIYFKSGAYSPDSEAGQHVLAHELAHTLQQGASSRVAAWWPKGHKKVTDFAFNGANLRTLYSKSARKFLVGRSPEMDNIADDLIVQQEGDSTTKAKLKEYKRLSKEGKAGNQRSQAKAKAMYIRNDIHTRDPGYVMKHGEGGQYKNFNGPALNKAETDRRVAEAAAMYDEKRVDSLELLSDALHQAGDRGSHCEGNPFEGHDSRMKLNTGQEWEQAGYRPNWNCDSVAENPKGMALGIEHVRNALVDYRQKIPKKGNNERRVKTRVLQERTKSKRMGLWGLGKVLAASNGMKKVSKVLGVLDTLDMTKSWGGMKGVTDIAGKSGLSWTKPSSDQMKKVLGPSEEFITELKTDIIPTSVLEAKLMQLTPSVLEETIATLEDERRTSGGGSRGDELNDQIADIRRELLELIPNNVVKMIEEQIELRRGIMKYNGKRATELQDDIREIHRILLNYELATGQG